MGVSATAAFTAINRVDDYAYIAEQNIGHAMTSVMAQNRGAGEYKRVRAAFQVGMIIELIYGVGDFFAVVCQSSDAFVYA